MIHFIYYLIVNVYVFDSAGFLSQVSHTFLQVVGLLGGPEIPSKPVLAMFSRWNWRELRTYR